MFSVLPAYRGRQRRAARGSVAGRGGRAAAQAGMRNFLFVRSAHCAKYFLKVFTPACVKPDGHTNTLTEEETLFLFVQPAGCGGAVLPAPAS